MAEYIKLDEALDAVSWDTEAYTAINMLDTMEIIHCKDCRKHNIEIGDYEELPDGKRRWLWKADSCPLIAYRGKAKGHEFDYQYCSCAEGRDDA